MWYYHGGIATPFLLLSAVYEQFVLVELRTCFRVEAGTVPGADDSVGSEGALDKRSSVMGTLSTKSAHYSILPEVHFI